MTLDAGDDLKDVDMLSVSELLKSELKSERSLKIIEMESFPKLKD
jgi:hypothetical protein